MEENENKSLPKSDKEDKSVTLQVLDYYKLFSQNRDLPKYFCGTSEVNVEQWKQVPHFDPILVTKSISPTEREIPKIQIEKENVCVASPSSSITSHRKLEWDNGADIGYSNTTLHKSVSLPVLTDADYQKLRSKLLSHSVDQVKDVKQVEDKFDGFKVFDLSSTSESLKSSPKGYISTTPTSGEFNSENESSKAQRLRSLTRKVGLPIAQSTHIDTSEACATPKLDENNFGSFTVSDPKVDFKVVDRISQYKNIKLLKLNICKPIVVECLGWTRPPRGKSKEIQTSFSLNGVSIGVQTDFDFNNGEVIIPNRGEPAKQNVFYVCYSDSLREDNSTNCSTIHTQTTSDFSQCDSFQFYNKASAGKKRKFGKRIRSDSSIESDKENLPVATAKQSDESLTNALLKSRKEKRNLKDLQRTVDLLQRLMHSQKYDNLTKKIYLKAIIKQFLDSKSESSDSVLPQSETSESTSTLSKESATKNVLGKLKSQIFSVEIPPSTVVDSNNCGKKKRSRYLTLTDSDLYDTVATNTKERSDTNKVTHQIQLEKNSKELPVCKDASINNSSLGTKSKSEKSWREDKTESERLLEKGAGDTCNLKQFSSSDDRNGLMNEVLHLDKLKKMLETHGATASAKKELCELTQKPRIEEMKGVRKTTTVYVLSTEKEIIPSKTQGKPTQVVESNNSLGSDCKCDTYKHSTFDNTIIEIGGDRIRLQDAHLVSSEEFTSKTDHVKGTTVIRRYTFEIPLEGAKSKDIELTPVYVNDNMSGRSAKEKKGNAIESDEGSGGSEHSKATRVNYVNVSGNVRHDPLRKQRSEPTSKESGYQWNAREYAEKQSQKDLHPEKSIHGKISETSEYLSQRSNSKKTKQSSGKSVKLPEEPSPLEGKDFEGGDKSTLSHKLDNKSSLTSGGLKENGSTYSIETHSTNSSLMEKDLSNLTGELVYVDDIPGYHPIDVVQSQEGESTKAGTLSKEFVYSDSILSTSNSVSDKIVIQLCECAGSSKSLSSLCVCCKEREVQTSPKTCQCSGTQTVFGNEKYILCQSCYDYHQQFPCNAKPYFSEGYVCECSPSVTISQGVPQNIPVITPQNTPQSLPQSIPQNNVIEIKKTIQQLENLETTIHLCQCDDSYEEIISNTDLCERCNGRLRSRYRRRKGGLAYAVTVQSNENLISIQNSPMESLEEIKIRPPNCKGTNQYCKANSNKKDFVQQFCEQPKHGRDQSEQASTATSDFNQQFCIQRKRAKDYSVQTCAKMADASTKCSNCYCCLSESTQTTTCKQVHKDTDVAKLKPQIVINTCKCKCKREKKLLTKCEVVDLEEGEHFADCRCQKRKVKKDPPYTLQEYLCKNRPRFIVMAEQRRQCLLNLAAYREENSQKYKKLLGSAIPNTKVSQSFKVKKPFTSKEMKQITAKNYKKCPEVQRKLEDVRERQLRRANKQIYDMFNQNLQQRVLQGHHTLPLEANVVNFY